MKSPKYPDITNMFNNNVHQKYLDNDGDPDIAIDLVDKFLENHPYYTEALIFKARMFIAKDRNQEALDLLNAVKKIDARKANYAFDEAEILYKFGQKIEAIQCVKTATELLLTEILEGLENFLIGIDLESEERDNILEIMNNEIIRFISKNSGTLDFNKIVSILKDHVMIPEHNKTMNPD